MPKSFFAHIFDKRRSSYLKQDQNYHRPIIHISSNTFHQR